MIPSPSLPWFELARFRRSRLTRAAIVAVLMVPLFYGALYVWANIDPTNRLDSVKAAVVNEDKLVEVTGRDGKKQPVAVGRQLAANLVRDDDQQNYDWQLTDAQDAQRGLANGEYKAVLTLPKNLSKAATSTSGDPSDAVQGQLDLQTNDAVNYVNGQIAPRILSAAKSALNAQVTETYLDNVYLSMSDIKASLAEAGRGAGRLADGAGRLQDGVGQLGDGARTLADGNRQLANGAGQLDSGAQTLSSGLGRLDDATSQLPSATRRLANGSAQVAKGVSSLNTVVQTVTSAILEATNGAVTQIGQVQQAIKDAAAQCHRVENANCRDVDRAVELSRNLGGFVERVRAESRKVSAQVERLNSGAAEVADGNKQLAAQAPRLADGVSQAAGGADRLAAGTGQLRSGADAAAAGADKLAAGTGQLEDGADQLAAGALKLRNGLTDGAGQVPDYDKSERETMAKTVATPLEDAAKRVNAVSTYGEGLAPYFIALALWVGAMAVYLLLRPFSARAVASTGATLRVALAGLAPGVVLSAVQAVLLVAVLGLVVGVDAASWPLVTGLALLTGVVFTAINQMCIALFGPAGRFVAIVLVCLQLTSAGGTYPIETAPGFFGFLHPLLPMSYAVHGIRGAIAGGHDGLGQDVFALVVFALLAIAVTTFAVRRRQSVTLSRLHPTLVV